MHIEITKRLSCLLISILILHPQLQAQHSHTYGRTQPLPQLQKQLQNTSDDSTKAYLLNEISWAYHVRNLDSAAYYANAALTLARQINYPSAEGRAINLQAVIAYIRQYPVKSSALNHEVLKIGKAIQDSFLITAACNDLSSYHSVNGNLDSSFIYLNESRAYLRSSDTLAKVFVLSNLAILQEKLGYTEDAADHFEKT
jgi:hypothetical protein